jgi:hypothetical protein
MTLAFAMYYRFDPRIFIDQPMHLAPSGESDFRVIVAGHIAGRIFATLRSSSRNVWLWTVTGPYLPGAGLNGSGDADDLPDAKKAFRATFDAWLQWAIRQNAPVTWHE